MRSGDHFYIALSIQVFERFICPWIGLVNDCCILRPFSLDCHFLFFSSRIFLEKVWTATKKIQNDIRESVVSPSLSETHKGIS